MKDVNDVQRKHRSLALVTCRTTLAVRDRRNLISKPYSCQLPDLHLPTERFAKSESDLSYALSQLTIRGFAFQWCGIYPKQHLHKYCSEGLYFYCDEKKTLS